MNYVKYMTLINPNNFSVIEHNLLLQTSEKIKLQQRTWQPKLKRQPPPNETTTP